MDSLPQFDIPNKLYFKIGEVSKICDLPAYVLRFWEKEFSQIRPKRTETGQRLYRQKDVTLVLIVKHLLHKKKFTIQGARQYLKSARKSASGKTARRSAPEITLREIRRELESIKSLLPPEDE